MVWVLRMSFVKGTRFVKGFSGILRFTAPPGAAFPSRGRAPAGFGGRFEEEKKNRHPCFLKNKGVATVKFLKNARSCPGQQK